LNDGKKNSKCTVWFVDTIGDGATGGSAEKKYEKKCYVLKEDIAKLEDLVINLGGLEFTIPPVYWTKEITHNCHLLIRANGNPDVGFMLGQPILHPFKVYFDYWNYRFGFEVKKNTLPGAQFKDGDIIYNNVNFLNKEHVDILMGVGKSDEKDEN